MARDSELLEVSLNLLTFLEADPRYRQGNRPRCEELLRFLTAPASKPDLDALVAAYHEVTGPEHHRLTILPAEQNIFEKIVLPLRAAIGSYMLGNYLGTVAICGMVCEMLAILTYDIAFHNRGPGIITKRAINTLGDSSFELAGQSKRVKALRQMNLIGEKAAERYRTVLKIRRRYLHLFSQSHEPLSTDARLSWGATRELALEMLQLRLKESGRVAINPELLKYIRDRGMNPTVAPQST